MTQEDIMKMACASRIKPQGNSYASMLDELTHFAMLIARVEREECARVCDELPNPPISIVSYSEQSIYEVATLDCAEAIRARGQK